MIRFLSGSIVLCEIFHLYEICTSLHTITLDLEQTDVVTKMTPLSIEKVIQDSHLRRYRIQRSHVNGN